MSLNSGYLIDTSVLIEMGRKKKYLDGAISVITFIEFLRGVRQEKRSEAKDALKSAFDIIGIEDEVVESYLELYDYVKSEGQVMSDLDLIIASTALAGRFTLLTKDRDFEPISERLKIKFV